MRNSRNQDKRDDELVIKIAAGVIVGGLALGLFSYIRDRIEEHRRVEQVNKAIEEFSKSAQDADGHFARMAAESRAAQEREAQRHSQERQMKAVLDAQAKQLLPSERCVGKVLLRKDGEMWNQITGSEAALKCSL